MATLATGMESSFRLKSSLRKSKYRSGNMEDQSFCNSRSSRTSTHCKPIVMTRTHPYPKILLFSVFYCFNYLLIQIAGVFFISQVTSVETRFSLDDKFSAFIIRCVEIGYVCSVIFSTHFLKINHVPRILLGSAIMYGAITIVLCLIFFADPGSDRVRNIVNRTSSDGSFICNPLNTSDSIPCVIDGLINDFEDGPPLTWLVTGLMVLLGVTMAPRFPLSSTYIDNNNPDKFNSGLYIGIAMIPSSIGPPSSFTLRAVFSNIPQAFQDARWIGTWWVVYVVLAVVIIIFALLFCYFPKEIDIDDAQPAEQNKNMNFLENAKDLPNSIYRVLRCPVYILTLASTCMGSFAKWGVFSFSPKYVQHQFQITENTSNIIKGVMMSTSGLTGTLLGGYLTSRYKLNIRGALRVAMVLYPVSLALNALTTLFGCSDPQILGFENRRFSYVSTPTCYCSEYSFLPVCADDCRTYYSPCVAGCTDSSDSGFYNCNTTGLDHLISGTCGPGCTYLYPFLGARFLSDVLSAMVVIPMYIVLLRSVPEDDKSMALALMSFVLSVIGYIAAPIVFGYVINTTCLIWSNLCTGDGSCALFDLATQRVRLKVSETGVGVFGILFLVWSYLIYERQEALLILELKETKKMRVNSVVMRAGSTKS